MNIINNYLLSEEKNSSYTVPFVIHKHNPRSGSLHYDFRFLDVKNNKLLHSFAFGSDFLEKVSKKISGVKTRDHDPRWLTLKSYRLEEIDKGQIVFQVFSNKYFKFEIKGKKIKGNYILFKLKTKRDDQWLLIKK